MHDVLVIYKQIEMRFDDEGNLLPFEENEEVVHTLSYDEKPGIQAIATIGNDKLPVPDTGKTSTIMRDYEYVRHVTVSLLLLYFEEVNAVPVPYKWKYRMNTIDLKKEDISQIVYEVVNATAASAENKRKMHLNSGRWITVPTRNVIWSNASSRKSNGFAGFSHDTISWMTYFLHLFRLLLSSFC